MLSELMPVMEVLLLLNQDMKLLRLRVSNRVLEKKWKCLLQGDIVLILQ